MELNTEQGLDENELNSLDNESENQDHVSEPLPPMQQAEPVEAKEFCLIETPEGFKMQLGSCCYDSITLSNQALVIYNKIKENKNESKTKSYLG